MSDDPAYARLDAVIAMADRLVEGQRSFHRLEKQRIGATQRGTVAVATRLAGTPLAHVAYPLRRSALKVQAAREEIRREVLFTSDKLAWRRQAGQATALLSIQYAHELHSETSPGRFPTMSGPLNAGVLDLVFDDRASDLLRGRSLVDAATAARRELFGRAPDLASAASRRRVVALEEFVHQPVSDEFKQIVQYCVDALGIRSRKRVVSAQVTAHVRDRRERSDGAERMTLLSVGCGTAVPVFEVASALRAEGASVHIILVDQDPLALAAAQVLAEQPEFNLGGSIELHCRRLFTPAGIALNLAPVIRGRRIHLVEDTGLREYLPARVYRSLTRTLWAALSPGGLMSTGNMLTHRPQADFLHGLMGWEPTVWMRSIRAGFVLHERAGVPSDVTRAYVTSDGVYALYLSTKPGSE